jgi:hypothetical protein
LIGLHQHAQLNFVLWPQGNGSVGCGANVGTNQTSQASDQELRPGEGMLLGPGVQIDLPADFSRSPYSIIAGGVRTPPQKVTFPFALIKTPSASCEGIALGCNEIFPGWVLTDNLYVLKRNQRENRARNQTRRQRLEFDMLRPEIIDLVREAHGRLQAISSVKEVYTASSIEGLGDNVLFEMQRKRAVDTYQFFIRLYVLLGLKVQVHRFLRRLQGRLHGASGGWRDHALGRVLDCPRDDPRWEHQRQLLQEDMRCRDVADALAELPEMLETIARRVEIARVRNDRSGVSIIDDYADCHIPACQDTIVQQTWSETRRLQKEVNALLGRLSKTRLHVSNPGDGDRE